MQSSPELHLPVGQELPTAPVEAEPPHLPLVQFMSSGHWEPLLQEWLPLG